LFVPVGLAIALVLIVWAFRVPNDRDVLLARIARNFPLHASDFVRKHQMAPPLFNTYRWGSFLIWYLPEYPVAIDERRGLYPEQEQLEYFKMINLEIRYTEFPAMDNARTLLLDKADVIAEALRSVPGFHLAYEDDISVIYTRTSQLNSSDKLSTK
jgi:hypothetical protein